MKKYLFMLIGLLLVGLPSCTDKDDVEISYEEAITITAKHLFDGFTPYESNDFVLSDADATLNIEAYVYDETGNLVEKSHFESDKLSEDFIYKPSVTPGNYKVVAIAHFTIDKSNKEFHYWNISGDTKLSELIIDASYENGEYIFTTSFETLGLYIGDFTVDSKPKSLSIDIKPVTSLVEVFTTCKSYTGLKYDEIYSTKCLNAAWCDITAPTIKDRIRFVNGQAEFVTSEQLKDYSIYYTEPCNELFDRTTPVTRCYRALLPENNKSFDWTVDKMRSSDETLAEVVDMLVCEYPNTGKSSSLNIESGRQYLLTMILDAPQLLFKEMQNESFNFENQVNEFMNEFNRERIRNTVDFGWEHLMRAPVSTVNQAFGKSYKDTYYSSKVDRYSCDYWAGKYNQFYVDAVASFLESSLKTCVGIQLQLSYPGQWGNPLSDENVQYIIDLLNEKFTFNISVGDMYGWFVGTKADAKTIVIFDFTDRSNACLYFRDREYNW